MTIHVGRPKRAASVSTTIITFRLTADEGRRLVQLAKELGHKDRSALLRAWIAQSGPIPQFAQSSPIPHFVDDASRLPAQAMRQSDDEIGAGSTKRAPAKTIETTANAQPRATARSNRNDEAPKPIKPSDELTVQDIIDLIETTIRRENDPRSGLSHVPGVVRSLLPGITVAQTHAIVAILHQAGMIELRPHAGERLSDEDAALCPRDARGTVLSRVRWIRKRVAAS